MVSMYRMSPVKEKNAQHCKFNQKINETKTMEQRTMMRSKRNRHCTPKEGEVLYRKREQWVEKK